MTTPPKYEDLVLKVAELEMREAALHEEVLMLKKGGQLLIGDRDSLQQRLTVAEQRADMLEREFKKLRDVALEAALKFYADGDHLMLADAYAWDACSGESINFLHDEAGTASVEDGSIAKAALKPPEGEGS